MNNLGEIMNTPKLDLNLLFVFEAIYTTGNISQAARQLNLSQPATSNALSRLRKQLDDQLFVRDGNGVVPTGRSEAMIESVRLALKTIEQSLDTSEKFDPLTSKRHFRIIVADPLEPFVLPGLLRDISLGTQITYELLPPQRVNIDDALLQDKIDLALFLTPGRNDGIVSKSLCPVDLVLLARKGHPRINGTISSEQIMQENHVGLPMAPGKLENSDKMTVWHKLKQRTVCHVNKVSSTAQTVAFTDLIGFVPRIYAEHIAKHYDLQIIELATPLSNQHFQMIWHKRNDVDNGQIWLRNKILDVFSDRTI